MLDKLRNNEVEKPWVRLTVARITEIGELTISSIQETITQLGLSYSTVPTI
jgi:hypothetical protein